MSVLYAANKDDQDWQYDDIRDAIIDLLDDDVSNLEGNVFTVYEGELNVINPSNYLPYLPGVLVESIGPDAGFDITEKWADDLIDLQSNFKKWFIDYLKKRDNMPKFGFIVNIKPVKVKLTDVTEFDFEYEVIEE